MTTVSAEHVASAIAQAFRDATDRTTAGLRRVRRAWTRELRAAPPRQMLKVAELLLALGTPRWFVYELLHHHKPVMAQLTAASLRRLAVGLSSWGEVDPYGLYLLGPAWRDGHLPDAELLRWTRSKDRFHRRAALVATVALNNTARGGKGDPDRTLLVCDALRTDRDDMVVKALSWALRELAQKRPQVVERYVRAHEAELAARVRREVCNKLRTGLKSGARSGH